MKEKNESGTAVQFREKASAIGTLKYPGPGPTSST
jgi:hypothetical protein